MPQCFTNSAYRLPAPRLYVKSYIDNEDDPDDPILWIISVKRDDRAVK